MNAALLLFHIILLQTLVAITTCCGQTSYSLGIKTSSLHDAATDSDIYAKIAYHVGNDGYMTNYRLLDNWDCNDFKKDEWGWFNQFDDISSHPWDAMYIKNDGDDALAITGIKYIGQDVTSQKYYTFTHSSDVNDCFEGNDFWIANDENCRGVAIKLCNVNYGEVFKDSSFDLNVGWCYTPSPTPAPTINPSHSPTPNPSNNPTSRPTNSPTYIPTDIPTNLPTNIPTIEPTIKPSINPTNYPTSSPTTEPSQFPSQIPSQIPVPTVVPDESNTSGSNGISGEIIILIVALGVIYCGIIMIGLYVYHHTKNKKSMDNDKNDHYVQLMDPNEPKIFGTTIKSGAVASTMHDDMDDVNANDSDEDVLNEMITPQGANDSDDDVINDMVTPQ